MGLGIVEIIGVFLIAFVVGAAVKDWVIVRGSLMLGYLSALYSEFQTTRTERNPWYQKYQKALKEIETLDYMVKRMDEARDSLHEVIRDQLTPKIKAQETSIIALNTFLEGRTEERNALREQVKDAYAKIEHLIAEFRTEHNKTIAQCDNLKSENRMLDTKAMSLEADVEYLRSYLANTQREIVRLACELSTAEKKKKQVKKANALKFKMVKR